MPISLNAAGDIAQRTARQAVRDAMDARERDSPYEATEAFQKIAVLKELLAEKQARAKPVDRFRIVDEMKVGDITNIPPAVGVPHDHPIDLVLLYPLDCNSQACDPWSARNKHALALIEMKLNFSVVSGDLQFLNAIAKHTAERPVEWVMVVVFINGRDAATVRNYESQIRTNAATYQFAPVTTCQPEQAMAISAPATLVGHRWFDVMCYGKLIV